MARALWLADALRAGGCTVVEHPGWRTRGVDSFTPIGVGLHETRGSASSSDSGEIGVLINGRVGLSGPISQLYLSRTGVWHVIASGVCHHMKTGTAGLLKGHGNSSIVGVEAAHAEGERWTESQYGAYVRGVAALCNRMSWNPLTRVTGHKEHQPGEKTDPSFSCDIFRGDVVRLLRGDSFMALTEQQWKNIYYVLLDAPSGQIDAVLGNLTKNLASTRLEIAALRKEVADLSGKDVVDEAAIVQGVLAGLGSKDVQTIADALSAALGDEKARAVGTMLMADNG